jgi:uncharacterized protein YceK
MKAVILSIAALFLISCATVTQESQPLNGKYLKDKSGNLYKVKYVGWATHYTLELLDTTVIKASF